MRLRYSCTSMELGKSESVYHLILKRERENAPVPGAIDIKGVEHGLGLLLAAAQQARHGCHEFVPRDLASLVLHSHTNHVNTSARTWCTMV